MEQLHSWDSDLILIYQIDVHDLKTEMRMWESDEKKKRLAFEYESSLFWEIVHRRVWIFNVLAQSRTNIVTFQLREQIISWISPLKSCNLKPNEISKVFGGRIVKYIHCKQVD